MLGSIIVPEKIVHVCLHRNVYNQLKDTLFAVESQTEDKPALLQVRLWNVEVTR